jgi:hypothetical protein
MFILEVSLNGNGNGKSQADYNRESDQGLRILKEATQESSILKCKTNSSKIYNFAKEFKNLPTDAQLTVAKLMQCSVLKNKGLSAEEIIENPELIERTLSAPQEQAPNADTETCNKMKLINVDRKLHNLKKYKTSLQAYYNMHDTKEVPFSLPQIEMQIRMFETLEESGVKDINLPLKSVEQELNEASKILRSLERQNEAQAKVISEMKKALLEYNL